MKMILRWFGQEHDKITLAQIRQIPGVSGIATSLMSIPVGEVWSEETLQALKREVEAQGLEAEVIESVNIHEDIKLGLPTRDKYIANYIETMKNLSAIGVKVICYNFMPVLDWARSNLYHKLPDGSETMYYNNDTIMNISPSELAALYKEQCKGIELPGWEPERMAVVNETIAKYKDITEDDYYEHIKYFLDKIIPYAEQYEIKMAIHPDDPPWPIFGLPRLIVNRDNIRKFLDLNKSVYNGLTLCTGSLGANKNNDIPAIVREFSTEGRIHFAHIRNLRFDSEKSFYESAHLSACGSLDMYEIVKVFHDTNFSGYIRPDHGRMIWGETGRPGYGLYDRGLGATYLLGLWEALEKNKRG